jgi:ORF6N domain
LLDADLARLYGVETRALNQAVKRNHDRFPAEFAFSLTREEILGISQTVTSLIQLQITVSLAAGMRYRSGGFFV